jgi:hypothetical protein
MWGKAQHKVQVPLGEPSSRLPGKGLYTTFLPPCNHYGIEPLVPADSSPMPRLSRALFALGSTWNLASSFRVFSLALASPACPETSMSRKGSASAPSAADSADVSAMRGRGGSLSFLRTLDVWCAQGLMTGQTAWLQKQITIKAPSRGEACADGRSALASFNL